MPTEFDNDAPEPLPPSIRAAFGTYPTPKPDAAFDARFWRELEARRNRYRGFAGFWRRLIEVEIEGVAVWRLGCSALGGSGSFALVFAVLGAFSSLQAAAPLPLPPLPSVPTAAPGTAVRYARQWDNELIASHSATKKTHHSRKPNIKGGFSCTRFGFGLV